MNPMNTKAREPWEGDFKLYYGDILVGNVSRAVCDYTTWDGPIVLTIKASDGKLQERLLEFIKFCEEWTERAHRDEPADPDEFKQFNDLLKSGLWRAESDEGDVHHLPDTPVFFAGSEVSWRED